MKTDGFIQNIISLWMGLISYLHIEAWGPFY